MAPGTRVLIALGAAIAAGFVVPTAQADVDLGQSHGVHYFSEAGTDLGPVDVACGGGTHPTGGGFEQPSIAGEPYWSFPLGDSWGVFMHVPASGGQPVMAYLMCKKGKLRDPEKQVVVGAGKTRSAKVGCPGQTHVAGGGGLMEANGGDGWINSSYPYDDGDSGHKPDDGWKVRVYNQDGDSHTMRVNAICQKRQPRYADESINLVPSSSSAAIAGCRSSQSLIGAGMRLRGQASGGIPRALRPRDAGDGNDVPDDGVLANASNEPGAPKDKKLTGFAICDK